MSTTIDQRVVEMQFDNRQFESNASTTISTLSKLKQSLNFTGASKGLENVGAAAKNCDVSFLGGAVETVKAKFSALEVMGVTALANITNSAVNAGKRIASALTIDPIKMGFSEYETQINAVQTILANTESKGKTLDDVNAALDELNTYADKTIYNFTEMTRNIGTFTAAGVDLDTSVSAIKGIANLAAVSGSTSQQASTAMYQLSQALASGTVKLMDWNSVVNAGMGGQVFQDALKETAKVHGVAIDDIIKKNGSFRESLSEGWLTSEILTETLSKFTGDLTEEQLKSMGYTEEQIKGILKMGKTANDAATKVKTFSQLFDTLKEAAQSGWTQTWEIIVGDFEEAKEFLTEVSDTIGAMIGSSAEARNELLENWKVLGGRTALIDSLRNAFEGIMSIVKPIKEAFRDIFPPMTSKQLFNITEGLKNLTAKMKIGDGTADKIKRTFRGLFAVFGIVKQAISAVFKAVGSLMGGVGELGGGILGITANIGDWLVKLNDTIKSSDIFNKTLQGIVAIIKVAVKGFKTFVGVINDKIVSPGIEIFHDLLEKVGIRMTGISEIASKMGNGVAKAVDVMTSALLNCGFVKVISAIWNAVKKIATFIGNAFKNIAKGITNAIGEAGISGVLDFLNTLLTGGILIKIISFIKNMTASFGELKDVAGGFLGKITSVLDGVRGCLESFQEKLKAEALHKIATAIGILTVALLVLAFIDSDRLMAAIGAITTLFSELVFALKMTDKFIDGSSGLLKTASAMILVANALLVLSVAMKIMGSMSWSEMARGLIITAVSLNLLVKAIDSLDYMVGDVRKHAAAIQKLSTALLVLSVAMKIMGSMSWSEMARGLIITAVSLNLLVKAIDSLDYMVGDVRKNAAAIMKLSTALLTLSLAMKIMGSMSLSEVGIGLLSMGVGLTYLVLAVNALPKDTSVKAACMISIASAVLILSAAFKVLGSMSFIEMAVALGAFSGAIIVLVTALNLMQAALPGAFAMLIVAPALISLAIAMQILSSLSLSDVGTSLLAIGGALLILAVGLTAMILALPGALALPVAAKGLVLLATALALFSAISFGDIVGSLGKLITLFLGLTVASIILIPFAVVLGVLSVAMAIFAPLCITAGVGLLAFSAGLAAIAGIGAAGVAALVSIVKSIVSLIPIVIEQIGVGIIAFAQVIADGAPVIGEAVIKLLLAISEAIIVCSPKLIEALGVLLTNLLDFIVEFVPKLVDAGMKIIIGFLEGIANNIGKVVEMAVKIIVNFIDGIASQIPKVIQAGINLILKFINGLANGIRENTPKVIAAVNNLMSAIFEAIGQAIGNIPSLGVNIAKGLAKGIRNGASEAINAAKNLGKKVWNSVKKFFKINSPSKKFAEIGMGLNEGLALGLKKYSNLSSEAAINAGEGTMDAFRDSISGISDAVDHTINSQPTIRPVLDLSDIRSGASKIGSIFGSGASVGVSANIGAVSSMMAARNQNGGNDDVVSAINKLRKDMGGVRSDTYNINGITYDDGSSLSDAIKTIVRAARVERRV